MITVCEASRISGVSIRTLHYYDKLGLLPAAKVTEAGYRLYDQAALERLQIILLFRELEFPLKEIGRILDSTDFDRNRALEQQIQLLELKKERLEKIIGLAKKMKTTGGEHMSFQEFDDGKIKEYEKRAKESWGHTEAYREYEKKAEGRTVQEQKKLGIEMMRIFEEIGQIREQEPDCAEALALVKKLQEYISEHYYSCSNDILLSLGEMYVAGGAFTDNIDRAGGKGTAAFADRAIRAYCGKGQEKSV